VKSCVILCRYVCAWLKCLITRLVRWYLFILFCIILSTLWQLIMALFCPMHVTEQTVSCACIPNPNRLTITDLQEQRHDHAVRKYWIFSANKKVNRKTIILKMIRKMISWQNIFLFNCLPTLRKEMCVCGSYCFYRTLYVCFAHVQLIFANWNICGKKYETVHILT